MKGYFGEFGGQYVPETLLTALDELEEAFNRAWADSAFRAEFEGWLRDYVGRPTPLTHARRLSEHLGHLGIEVWLKREDLNHTGAHKINNAIGQILLAGRMGKKRVIAETGAGQHGVATATVCALFGLEGAVYMGTEDIVRQRMNVERMRLLGAEVVPVSSGTATLKDATSEAIRDWVPTWTPPTTSWAQLWGHIPTRPWSGSSSGSSATRPGGRSSSAPVACPMQ